MADGNAEIIAEFRANGGKVGGNFDGAPLLLLHTTGARTGKERVNPMMYEQVGDDVAVIASKGGAPSHPDWFHNLVANPRARVEVGTDTFDVVARVTSGEERVAIWTKQKLAYPGFADYERATKGEIPVIVLTRVA